MRNQSRTDVHNADAVSAKLLMMRFVNARSVWFKVILVLAALWAPLSQADTGWQPIQETIRKAKRSPTVSGHSPG